MPVVNRKLEVANRKLISDTLFMSWNHERAKELIAIRGRTRRWVAEQCGLEVKSLNNILRGRKPGRPVLKLMARALETTEGYLDGEEPEQIVASG